MRVVLQRVHSAKVEVDSKLVNSISHGYLLLVGFKHGDGTKEIDYLSHKIINARLFEDKNHKMNLSIKQIKGEILSISQFTLYSSNKNGNRPSFIKAQDASNANINYNYFNEKLCSYGVPVKNGIFGSHMLVSLINDGPVTIIYDTDNM